MTSLTNLYLHVLIIGRTFICTITGLCLIWSKTKLNISYGTINLTYNLTRIKLTGRKSLNQTKILYGNQTYIHTIYIAHLNRWIVF